MIILYWVKCDEVKNTLPADESAPYNNVYTVQCIQHITFSFLFDHKIFIYIRADHLMAKNEQNANSKIVG